MAKLTREDKIEIYLKRKQGETVSSLVKEYKMPSSCIMYLVRLVDLHGVEILRVNKNNYFSPELKLEIIKKVLIDKQSAISVALEYGLLTHSLVFAWIRSYQKHGCVIVKQKRGRKTAMKTTFDKKYKDMTPSEKVKYLEEQNQYLEAENKYLKKLEAVVQARKNQQPKKK